MCSRPALRGSPGVHTRVTPACPQVTLPVRPARRRGGPAAPQRPGHGGCHGQRGQAQEHGHARGPHVFCGRCCCLAWWCWCLPAAQSVCMRCHACSGLLFRGRAGAGLGCSCSCCKACHGAASWSRPALSQAPAVDMLQLEVCTTALSAGQPADRAPARSRAQRVRRAAQRGEPVHGGRLQRDLHSGGAALPPVQGRRACWAGLLAGRARQGLAGRKSKWARALSGCLLTSGPLDGAQGLFRARRWAGPSAAALPQGSCERHRAGADGQACSVQVLAEKRAMQLAGELGVKLVAICPNFNLGPPLSARLDGTSVNFLKVLHGHLVPADARQPVAPQRAGQLATSACEHAHAAGGHGGLLSPRCCACCRMCWRASPHRAARPSSATSGTWHAPTSWRQSSPRRPCRAGTRRPRQPKQPPAQGAHACKTSCLMHARPHAVRAPQVPCQPQVRAEPCRRVAVAVRGLPAGQGAAG